MNLHVLKRVIELRNKGLGYRSIAKVICEELRACVSYRTIARWIKKYSWILERDEHPKTGCHFSDCGDNTLLSREPEDRRSEPVEDPPILLRLNRLGPTERLVLRVMLLDPHTYWTPTTILHYARIFLGLKAYSMRLTRRAVWAALKRLQHRGLVTYVPMVTLLAKVTMRGCYRLNPKLFRGDSLRVHNLRVPGHQVVNEDRSVPLLWALFEGSARFGEVPITQIEVNADYSLSTEVISYLKSLGWSQTVIYLKPELGILRFEHRLHPKDLTLSVNSYREVISRYLLLTKIVRDIAETEIERLTPSDRACHLCDSICPVINLSLCM